MPKASQDLPKAIRPYIFHGLDLRVKGEEAVGTCPFCSRGGKFSVNMETGQWRCFVCSEGSARGGGNIYTFFRLLLEQGQNTDSEEFAAERRLLSPDTLDQWGVFQSPITGEWVIPAYSPSGQIVNLYRYIQIGDKRRFIPAPELGHGLFGVPLFSPHKPNLYLLEGPWDAMCLWEVLRASRKMRGFDGYILSPREADSILATSNVLAVPGSGVFDERWLPLFSGKHVHILYDSDHQRKHPRTNALVDGAGISGTRRVVSLLLGADNPASSIQYVHWGDQGFDPALPSGYDVRDFLSTDSPPLADRVILFSRLAEKTRSIPEHWKQELRVQKSAPSLDSKHCTSWDTLVTAWSKALHWYQGLDTTLSVMLASVTSTLALGDQLWIKVIGPASCGKSTLCEALSVASKYVISKSTIRGFHSGYKTDKGGDEDNSLVALIKGKTLVTKDGDTLLQSPNLGQILSEARDLYDSVARTHYRNKTSRDYTGVRFTWLLCGTSSLRYIDSSELGERFLDCVVMDGIDDDLEDEILLRVAERTERALSYESNGQAERQYEPALAEAMRLTGGYVEYLRANAQRLLDSCRMPTEALRLCTRLGKFVAYIRARPSIKQEETAEREFAARLVSQHVRLAKCLAVVLCRPTVDEEVMRRVRKIALDTARGRTLELLRALHREGTKGAESRSLAIWTNDTDDKLRPLLRFLRRIGVLETFTTKITSGLSSKPRWRITERLKVLYEEVMSG